MNISPVQSPQTQNFRGLHVSKKALKGLECTEDALLKIPEIKECAKKYEVLIKRGKVNGHKNLDFIITALGGMLSSAIGGTIGFFISMYMCMKNKDITAMESALPMLSGMFGSPLLYTMGTILYRNKPTYEYIVQGGKGITHNALGETQLTGTKSKEYRIDKDNWHGVIQNMTKEIQDEDYGRFSRTIRKYNINELDNTKNILNILKDPVIKNEFSNGDCFNYKIGQTSLLNKFFDIIPTEENQKDYDEILQSMKSMKNIDYNQIDENGISVLEKIINSENTKALELVRNFEFEYLRELDYAYENIQNDTFKRKVKNLNIKFPHVFEALKNQSPDALDAAFEELNSPFCRKEKLVKEMIDFAYSNCRGCFLANVLFRKLQDENLLPKEAYDRMIAEREDRYNRWR